MNQVVNQLGSTIVNTDKNILQTLPRIWGGLSGADKRLLGVAAGTAVGGQVISRTQGDTRTGNAAGIISGMAGAAAVGLVGKDIIGPAISHSPMYLKHRGIEVAKEVARVGKNISKNHSIRDKMLAKLVSSGGIPSNLI